MSIIGKYLTDRSIGNYIGTPSDCGKCGKSLKNRKYYKIIGVAEVQNNLWTLKKKCKRCGYVNIKHKKG